MQEPKDLNLFTLFPKYVIKTLDKKWSCGDLNWFPTWSAAIKIVAKSTALGPAPWNLPPKGRFSKTLKMSKVVMYGKM